jgi:hypothetical protein
LALCLAGSLAMADGVNCSFRVDRDRYLEAEARVRRETYARTKEFRRIAATSSSEARLSAADVPRRSFIDNQIFDRIAQAGVPVAAPSSDEEFFRRIHFDLTGRLPRPEAIREFLADGSASKRNAVIDRLLNSPEFTDKWLHWLGDLFENAAFNSQQNLQVRGRNALFAWLKRSVEEKKTLRDLVWEALVAKGNSYDADAGGVAWHVRSRQAMGPIQDTYDMAFARAARQFLGVTHYDCILCHNGRGHLDGLSLWGQDASRTSAQRQAAFFSRMQFAVPRVEVTDPLYLSTNVADNQNGAYRLNTSFGNRPNRTPIGSATVLPPAYRDGREPAGPDWRAEFATFLVTDKLFAINLANRIWKQIFNLGLIEPVDQIDPARLDPSESLPDGWSHQASHPELLLLLTKELEDRNFDLREFVRLLVTSSAYQLSSRYDGEWRMEYVPLFARHYPRRLEGEEIFDAIQVATGVFGNLSIRLWPDPIRWAMQVPEPVEPNGSAAAAFMNGFLRGNRDTQERSQDGSIVQHLNLMNDANVTNRIRAGASQTVRALGSAVDASTALDDFYLAFLSRLPSAAERQQSLRYIESRGPAQRMRSAEDLAWALINRTEFIFSY